MKKNSTLLVMLLLAATIASAQEMQLKDSTFVPKKKIFRQYDYENHQSPFPAKKKDQWVLGLHGGFANMIGDINTQLGWAAGLRVQKALGHVFSLRLEALYGQVYGQDISRRLDPEYSTNGTFQKYYGNYKTQYAEVILEGMVTLNNINFYNKQPKVLVNLFLGPGVMFSETRTDKFDANGNKYDYSSVSDFNTSSDGGTIRKEIKAIRDGEYETVTTGTESKLFAGNFRVNPAITFGAGLSFRLSKVVDLAIEDRITYYGSDQLDGTRFTRNNEYSGNSDIINYASVGLHFKLGKRAQPHTWTNPLQAYGNNINDNALQMDTLKKKVKKMANEEKPADADGDGVPDVKDAEPFSAKGAKVDDRGVAVDTDGDGVKDFADMEPNTPAGAHSDAAGREIITTSNTSNSNNGGRGNFTAGNNLASVFFKLNKSEVTPEYYTEMLKVVNYLRENTNAKVIALGNADVRASDSYNMALSEKRINNCVAVLTTLGISADRVIKEPRGELDPMVPNLSDKTRKDDGRYLLNRRVDFRVAK